MKRTLLALFAGACMMAGSVGAASALYIGPGGVYLGHGPHRYYDYGGGCRTVITHHLNRWGNEVTVRRRTCD